MKVNYLIVKLSKKIGINIQGLCLFFKDITSGVTFNQVVSNQTFYEFIEKLNLSFNYLAQSFFLCD